MSSTPWGQRATCVAFVTLLLTLLNAPYSKAKDTDTTVSEVQGGGKQRNPGDDVTAGPASLQTPLERALSGYISNEDLEAHLQDYVRRCGAMSHLRSIGESVGGRRLWALVVGAALDGEAPAPAFRYVGNMHGDEPTGRVLLLALAEWLCARRGVDEKAARILEGMQLHLLPSMNPDGFADHSRNNRNGKDLNRNFPDTVDPDSGRHRSGPLDSSGTEQPETAALMRYARSRPFVASASMHEGALVANYPWDANDRDERGYAATPDDATFRLLARTYAEAHAGGMLEDPEFSGKGGITNGAEWYQVYGSMQDWSYVETHCMEVTLELSPQKWPPAESLGNLFAANLPAMLALPLAAAFSGLRGFVLGQPLGEPVGGGVTPTPLEARVSVQGIASFVVSGAAFGDYYRPLAPGQHTVQVAAEGYANASALVSIPDDGSGSLRNFTLAPLAGGLGGAAGGKPGASQQLAAATAGGRTPSENTTAAVGGGGSIAGYRSVLWTVAALALLLLVVWAVRRRRRRRRLWALGED